jgi:hypothetical protein
LDAAGLASKIYGMLSRAQFMVGDPVDLLNGAPVSGQFETEAHIFPDGQPGKNSILLENDA